MANRLINRIWISFLGVSILLSCNLYQSLAESPSSSSGQTTQGLQQITSSDTQSDGHTVQASATFNRNFMARRYILGPNDAISIKLPLTPELNQESIKIPPDGVIDLAPIGSVLAAGKTMEELRDILTEKYGYYLVNPQVAVNLVDQKPLLIQVTGAVLNPGVYELRTDTRTGTYQPISKPEVSISRNTPLLSNVLVAAGGLLFDSDLEHISIKNSIDHSEFEVNLLDLLTKGSANEDIYLTAGDDVYVPKLPSPLSVTDARYKLFASATFSEREIPVKVLGYVSQPGLVKLNTSQSLNINSAISAAGGYSYTSGAPYLCRKVYLSRLDANGHVATRVIDPTTEDVMVMPNDIVYVPDKPRQVVGKAFDYTARVFNSVGVIANSYNNWAYAFNPTRGYVIQGK